MANQTVQTASSTVHVIGAPKELARDVYHRFLRLSWMRALSALIVAFLALNVIFAALYEVIGGIDHARPGNFGDAFFFSVQTMATIGYGGMHPVTPTANLMVVVEAIVGLFFTAIVTGLMFAKFSVSNARVVFSRTACVTPLDGVPTLMFRLGNERSNQIVEAHLRVTLIRNERTKEGVTFYRMYDLKLSRERSQAFSRSWTALHVIEESSPLHGATPESLAAQEVELLCGVVGTDDTSLQPVHARHTYVDREIVFGARHADILSENPDGSLTLDLRRFHDTVSSLPTETFPYPRATAT